MTGDRPVTWVVGAGGLLGSSVHDSLSDRGEVWAPEHAFRWGTPANVGQVADATESFLRYVGVRPWQVAWCAGAAVTAADDAALAKELEVLGALLDRLAAHRGDHRRGGLFLASSAGGVYAGSAGQPFDERTRPRPLSPYGHGKMALEAAAREFHEQSGVPVLVGRISNLYGPRQDIRKPQGLVSHLGRAHLLGEPISIYVPLDTIRDYVFAPDCAEVVADGLARLAREGGFVVKVIASQQPVTVGFLVAEIGRVVKRRPPVVYGASPTGRFQARDLRLTSQVWTSLDRRAWTPYPDGIARTLEGLAASLRSGDLARGAAGREHAAGSRRTARRSVERDLTSALRSGPASNSERSSAHRAQRGGACTLRCPTRKAVLLVHQHRRSPRVIRSPPPAGPSSTPWRSCSPSAGAAAA